MLQILCSAETFRITHYYHLLETVDIFHQSSTQSQPPAMMIEQKQGDLLGFLVLEPQSALKKK